MVSSRQSQHTNKWSTSKHGEAELLSSEDLYTKLGGSGNGDASNTPRPPATLSVTQTQSSSVPRVPSLF